MKILILITYLSFIGFECYGNPSDNPILYIYADKLPKFNNSKGLHDYIYDNLKWSGKIDADGTVLVSFIVQKDGKVDDVKIEHSLVKECDEEVIRIFESMPSWEPGEKDSKIVDVKLYFPVEFKIKR